MTDQINSANGADNNGSASGYGSNLDQLGVNIVGAVDRSTRLFNRGEGFGGLTGSITFGALDLVYLGFIAERAYTVAVDGDLVLSTETMDAMPSGRTIGAYGYDVEWSEAARRRGNGVGKIVVTNPSQPDAPSVFEVTLGEVDIKVDVARGAGINAAFRIHDRTHLGALTKIAAILLEGKPVAIGMSYAAKFGLCNILPQGNGGQLLSPVSFGPEQFRNPEAAAAVLAEALVR